jgi:hypothetical protein
MTLVCVGIVVKQKYDWNRRQQLIHAWIGPLVELARAADGDITRYPDDPPQLTPPAGLPAEEQIPLLRWAILELETPEERLAALKILVESSGEASLPVIRELIPPCRHSELQATLLHLLSLARDPDDLPLFEKWLDGSSPMVRGAAAESIGMAHQPSYGIGSWHRWKSQMRSNTNPPIDLTAGRSTLTSWPFVAQNSGMVPQGLRDRLEGMMLQGATAEDRAGAARALLGWPPEQYSLRVAEVGVWFDQVDPRQSRAEPGASPTRQAQLATTTPMTASLIRARVESTIEITCDQPLVLDVAVSITGGRPWTVSPPPDTILMRTMYAGSGEEPSSAEWEEMEEPGSIPLDWLSSGYPWIHPDDRTEAVSIYMDPNAFALGPQWQSLIASPDRLPWMTVGDIGTDSSSGRRWRARSKESSAWLSSQDQAERFLYYEGPTTARSPVKASLAGDTLTLVTRDVYGYVHKRWRTFAGSGPTGLFVNARTTPARAFSFESQDRLDSKQILPLVDQTWVEGDGVEQTFLAMLLEQGLTEEEAGKLLDCWRERFFQVPGQRLLTLLTRAEYDRMCPLQVRPPATETVRVGIVLREF